ncbi:MAG: hypothetical protein K6G63_09475 [Eubacterium sp.]|nr:hypothetical protein [Eubacterium sp.]
MITVLRLCPSRTEKALDRYFLCYDGTVASIFIYNYFVQWLVILNCILPPIGAVIITDYFTGKKRGIAAINSIVISTIE